MSVVKDAEFGEITVRRSRLARYVRIKIGPTGSLVASLPPRTPLKLVQQLLNQSREELRGVLSERNDQQVIREHGSMLGKSHQLMIYNSGTSQPKSSIAEQRATVHLPEHMPAQSDQAQRYISDVVRKVLKKEAQAFLPRRVSYLAGRGGFDVTSVHFNNAKTRWGSCTSKRSINLNIALMQLPFELIDYVIVHELCHTKHLNHSQVFWNLVEEHCPNYKSLRKQLKSYHPYI